MQDENKVIVDDIIANVGLYSTIDISDWDEPKQIEIISNLDNLEEGIDLYCPICEKEAIFRNSNSPDLSGISSRIGQLRKQIENHPQQTLRLEAQLQVGGTATQKKAKQDNLNRHKSNLAVLSTEVKSLLLKDRFFSLELMCTRDNTHRIAFVFRKSGAVLEKIGQFPSISDFRNFSIKQYRKLLSNKKYKELTKSLGLYSHGIGIGSFVYLRRIFEYLLENAHSEAKGSEKWDEDKYEKSRISDRIKLLKDFLPKFLIDHAELYSILSDGVHNLSDDVCNQYYDTVYTGITLILDEQLAEQRRQASIKSASEAIKKIEDVRKAKE